MRHIRVRSVVRDHTIVGLLLGEHVVIGQVRSYGMGFSSDVVGRHGVDLGL